MFKGLTKGKIIAGVIALAIAAFFWNIFFPPGGSGANILLGLFVAIFFVYYFAGYVGGLIDQELFPNGSRKRARLYRGLDRFIRESNDHLSAIKRSKRRRNKIGTKALDDFEQALLQASLVLSKVREQWEKKSSMADHERMLAEGHDKLELASKAVFKLDRSWRFIYGMPSLILALLFALLLREFVIEPYQIPSGSMIPSLLVGDHLFVSKFYYGLSKPFTSNPDFLVQWRSPKPGDVIVFKAPEYVGRHANQAWIKRVIATEGQTIKIVNHVVYVDGKPYDHMEHDTIVTYMDFFGFGGPSGGEWREQTSKHSVEQIGGISHQIHMPINPRSFTIGPYWPHAGEGNLPGLSCGEQGCTIKQGHVFVMGDNRGNSADSRTWGALPISRIMGKALFIWMSVDGSEQSFKLGPFSMPRFRFDRWFTGIV
jgi:signal peptidase I